MASFRRKVNRLACFGNAARRRQKALSMKEPCQRQRAESQTRLLDEMPSRVHGILVHMNLLF